MVSRFPILGLWLSLMRSIRVRTALTFLLCSLSASAASLELEVSPGYAWSDVDASSPVLRARAGIDLGWFTPSIAGFTALFQDPGRPNDSSKDEGLHAWGVAAQARFHSTGRHQVVGGLGIGWGQLVADQWRQSTTIGPGYGGGFRGHPAPYIQAFAGYRAILGSTRLGLELTLDAFNRVDEIGDFQNQSCVSGPYGCYRPTASTLLLLGVAFTFGFGFL